MNVTRQSRRMMHPASQLCSVELKPHARPEAELHLPSSNVAQPLQDGEYKAPICRCFKHCTVSDLRQTTNHLDGGNLLNIRKSTTLIHATGQSAGARYPYVCCLC
jgi:hypothetical protein